jgi:hypothetical protein
VRELIEQATKDEFETHEEPPKLEAEKKDAK